MWGGHPFQTKMILTISVVIEEGEARVLLHIQHGGYDGKFWFDQNGQYLGAIELYNPP